MSPSIISTLRVIPKCIRKLGGEHAVDFHRNQPARPPRQHGVRAPRPGPISSTVLCETSPSVDDAAGELFMIKKCCPSLGLIYGRRGRNLGTLTLFFLEYRLAQRTRISRAGRGRSVQS